MTTFERSARVQHMYEAHNPYSNQFGTVTHLHSDAPDTQHPNGFDIPIVESVWVRFDNGDAMWIETSLLVRVVCMTQDAIQRRYDALNALAHPTREETTEAVYLYYKLASERAARLRDTPERVWDIAWCASCERAHAEGGCSIARQ